MGLKLNNSIIRQTFDNINTDKDDKLSFEEFFYFFSSLPSPDMQSVLNFFT